jgi:hypothetical protein
MLALMAPSTTIMPHITQSLPQPRVQLMGLHCSGLGPDPGRSPVIRGLAPPRRAGDDPTAHHTVGKGRQELQSNSCQSAAETPRVLRTESATPQQLVRDTQCRASSGAW